jgi:cyanophycin synthetase
LATITGDGTSTVAELIERQINSDPRRGIEQDYPLDKIRLDRQPHAVLELQRQGLNADSVVAKDRVVIVQRNGNMNHDVTAWVHPEVAAMATLAARVVGLDIAGIDMVVKDITKPLHTQGGAIVEVNAGPGLLMHLKPATGEPRPVGKAIVEHLFGANDDGRIPVVGITGSQQTALLSRLVGWLLHLSGKRTGVSCRDGLFMDQRLVEASDARGYEPGERLLINRALDAAVIETAARNIVEDGTPYDLCLVGVVTDLPTDDLSDHDMTTPEQMRTVIRTQMDVVLQQGVGVLNADDETIAGLAELCNGEVVFYGHAPEHPVIAEQIKNGKRAVFLRDHHVVLARGNQENPLFHIDLAPIAQLLRDGCGRHRMVAGHSAPADPSRPEKLWPKDPPRANQTQRHCGLKPWKSLAFAPCAAPICGHGTPPSRSWSSACPSTPTSAPCPASSRACATCFLAWARSTWRTRSNRPRFTCKPKPVAQSHSAAPPRHPMSGCIRW